MTGKLGATLRKLRRSRGLTQWDVAAAIEYSRAALSGAEAGGDKPGRDLLEKPAKFYGVGIDDLYAARDAPQVREFAKDENEVAVLNFWRSLDQASQHLFLLSLSRKQSMS